MSIWNFLNWAAWGLSALLLLAMLWDFIKVERQARAKKNAAAKADAPGPT